MKKIKEIRITTKLLGYPIDTLYYLPDELSRYDSGTIEFIFNQVTEKHLNFILNQIFIQGVNSIAKLRGENETKTY